MGYRQGMETDRGRGGLCVSVAETATLQRLADRLWRQRLCLRFRLRPSSDSGSRVLFFEMAAGCSGSPNSQMTGNPVRNRGRLRHCKGIQAPMATVGPGPGGKAGARQAPSQDTGLAVLVRLGLGPAASPHSRRMRPVCPASGGAGVREEPSFAASRSVKVFFRLVSAMVAGSGTGRGGGKAPPPTESPAPRWSLNQPEARFRSSGGGH
jgi:hypothetical protein